MIRSFKPLILLLLLIIGTNERIAAQAKIQVVTRTITRSFEPKSNIRIVVVAEKANIVVVQSKGNTIQVKLSLVSKNPDKAKAETDLKYCDYKISESDGEIQISNLFDFKNKNFANITSNLSARYEIYVPKGQVLKLKNIYGELNVTDVNSNMNIQVDFSQVRITNIAGSINIKASYSDIKGQNLDCAMIIAAENTDISISKQDKNTNIKSKYGTIKLNGINASTDIDADMTEIYFYSSDFEKYKFDINAIECDFSLPAEFKKLLFKNAEGQSLQSKQGSVAIKIRNKYSNINIEKK